MSLSKIEQTYINHPLLNHSPELLSSKTPITDKEGNTFDYKTDAYLESLALHIEFKADELNSITSTRTSRNRLLNQCKHRKLRYPPDASHTVLSGLLYHNNYTKDCLLYGWNHSAYKQRLVSADLGGRLLIVTSKPINKPYKGLLIISTKQFDLMLALVDSNKHLSQSELIQLVRTELKIPIPHLH